MNITDYLQQANQDARLKIEMQKNARLQRHNDLLRKFCNAQSVYIKEMNKYINMVEKHD